MYSLDINFLKERQTEGQAATRTGGLGGAALSEQLPLIGGGVVGVLIPALVGIWWMQLNNQTAQVNQEIAQLQAELSQLEASKEQIAALEAQRDAAQARAEQLTNIFEQIRPVSAVLQDVRDRLPPDVQVASLQHQQSGGGNVSISLSGVGRSYESINHFVLTLERSPFIEPETLQLQGASQTGYPGSPAEGTVKGVSPESVVSYSLSFQLNQVSASELLGQLEAKGATGLATRIKTLQAKGLIE